MASISLKYKSKQGNLTAPGDVDPGAMIPIATVTVGSTSVADITFSSIPSTYEHLQIRAIMLSTTANWGDLQFNNDTGNNYAWHSLYGDGSSAGADVSTSRSNILSVSYVAGVSSSLGGSIIDILDYSNTNKNKTVRVLLGGDNNSGTTSGKILLNSGLWMSTSAINSLKITARGGTFSQHSSFALYGIKRAGA